MIAARKASEYFRSAGAECTMAGSIFWKRWSNNRRLLVWQPVLASDNPGTTIRTGPGPDLLAREQIMDGRHRAYRIIVPFAIPARDTSIKKRIGESKK